MNRIVRVSLGLCLVLGCGLARPRSQDGQSSDASSADLDPLPLEPSTPLDDPPQVNPVRNLMPDIAPERPVAGSPVREATPIQSPDAMIERLLSAWTNNRLIDLLFPVDRFRHGPEFLDGGPNTLFRICIEDGTPDFICRQRYGP